MTDPHATDAHGPATGTTDQAAPTGDHDHDTGDHGDTRGHDDHAHADEAPGPIDVAAWGAGVLGIAIAVVIAACFVLATSGIG